MKIYKITFILLIITNNLISGFPKGFSNLTSDIDTFIHDDSELLYLPESNYEGLSMENFFKESHLFSEINHLSSDIPSDIKILDTVTQNIIDHKTLGDSFDTLNKDTIQELIKKLNINITSSLCIVLFRTEGSPHFSIGVGIFYEDLNTVFVVHSNEERYIFDIEENNAVVIIENSNNAVAIIDNSNNDVAVIESSNNAVAVKISNSDLSYYEALALHEDEDKENFHQALVEGHNEDIIFLEFKLKSYEQERDLLLRTEKDIAKWLKESSKSLSHLEYLRMISYDYKISPRLFDELPKLEIKLDSPRFLLTRTDKANVELKLNDIKEPIIQELEFERKIQELIYKKRQQLQKMNQDLIKQWKLRIKELQKKYGKNSEKVQKIVKFEQSANEEAISYQEIIKKEKLLLSKKENLIKDTYKSMKSEKGMFDSKKNLKEWLQGSAEIDRQKMDSKTKFFGIKTSSWVPDNKNFLKSTGRHDFERAFDEKMKNPHFLMFRNKRIKGDESWLIPQQSELEEYQGLDEIIKKYRKRLFERRVIMPKENENSRLKAIEGIKEELNNMGNKIETDVK